MFSVIKSCLLFFVASTMHALAYDNEVQKNHSSVFKSTIQYANSVNGVIFIGISVIGVSGVLSTLTPFVFDPLITEASKHIDAQENPKTGLAIAAGNVIVAGLYGVMLESAGLMANPMTFSWNGVMWGLKGTKCLITAACQFFLAKKSLGSH